MKFLNSPLTRFSAMVGMAILFLANAANPPNGQTGAPFDGGTCANGGCHDDGNPNGFGGIVSISGLPSVITPNTSFNITLTIDVTSGSPTRAGFQMVAVDGANSNAGDFTAGAGSGTEMAGGREYIEQRGAKVISGGQVSWSFTWKSPLSASGDITFYFIGNMVNNNGQRTGDHPITGTDSYTFQGGPPLSVTISPTAVTCNGGNDGEATANPDGGVPGYSFAWSNGQNTQTAVNLIAGNYTVTVTDNAGTTKTAAVTIGQPPILTVSASSTGTITCNNASATVNASASGGTPGYSFAWSDGQTGQSITVNSGGIYGLTVTDNVGCTKTTQVNVNANNTPPNADAGDEATLTCLSPTVALDGTASSTGAGITYLWTASNGGNIVSGANTLTPVVSAAGTYTLLVSNNISGCTSTASTTVDSGIAPPTASATGGTLTCAASSVSISASTNATQPTFAWSGPNNFTSTQQNPSVSTAGNYLVTITNTANGCTATASASVGTNTAAPNASATGGTLSCAMPNVQISGNSTTPNSTFSWTGPNGFTTSQANPTVSLSGTYLLIVTNPANGCTATATAEVTGNTTAPVASSTGGTLTCSALTISISANSTSSGATFAWSGPNGFASSNANPMVNTAGSYTCTVTNPANGCTATTVAVVDLNNTAPGASATATNITCSSPTATVSGTSSTTGVTYQWEGPGNFQSNQQNPTVSNAGNYTLIVTAPNGCTSTTTVSVSQNTTAPTATIAQPGNLNCSTSTIQLNGTGSSQGADFSYTWTTASGNFTSGTNTLTPTVNAAGDYNLLITNTLNGCTNSVSATVAQSPAVTASISGSANVACNGEQNGSATVAGAGGTGNFSIVWSNGATTATASNLAAGTYSATVTDSENCTATASATISQPNALAANASATAESANGANDGSATANPTGGTSPFAYAWTTGANTQTISNLAPGTYGVSVTDANGCTAIQTVTVNSFNCAISLAISSENISCNGANDGTATANVTGGTLPVAYLWSNMATTPTISNLSPGNYIVGILDANGCPATASVNISEPANLSANASATGVTANGATDGTATAQPTGGTTPYSYAWSNGGSTANINGLAPGSYTVSITDANGCSAVQTVNVNAFDCAISAEISSVNVSCFGGNNGVATVAITGGTAPFTYLWSNGGTASSIGNLPAGQYSVSVTDLAGCAVNQSVTIAQPDALSLVSGGTIDVLCPTDATGSATVIVSGGTLPYVYNWSNGQITPTTSNLSPGNYTCTVTDANACSSTWTTAIVSTDNVAPVITCPADMTVCEASVVQFPFPVATDNCPEPISVTQTSGPANGTVFPLGENIVAFSAKDVSGNVGTCQTKVTVRPLPNVMVTNVKNDIGGAGLGSIEITVSGTGGYTFNWTGPNGFASVAEDLENILFGNYTLVVTDDFGCQKTINVTVDNTIGTTEPGQGFSLRVLPNPASTSIRLEVRGSEISAGKILDLRGSVLLNISGEEIGKPIDISVLPAGVFQMLVRLENGAWRSATFVKNE